MMTMRLPEQPQQQQQRQQKKKKTCQRFPTTAFLSAMMMIALLIILSPCNVNALITTRQRSVAAASASPSLRAVRRATISPWRTTAATIHSETCHSRIQLVQHPVFVSSNSYSLAATAPFSGTAITALPRWFSSSRNDNNDDSSGTEISPKNEKNQRCFPWSARTARSGQTYSSPSTTTTRRSSFLRRLLTTRPSSSLSSSLSMSVSEEESDVIDKFPFDIKTAGSLVGGQSMLIVVGVVIAWWLKTPNFGFGLTFAILNQPAIQAGFLYTIPLIVLAVVLEFVEAYIPALQDVSAATQRSVLLLLGGTFRPVIGTITALALGVAAGVGEELIFRGIFQYELAQRVMTWLPWMSSVPLLGATAATAATTTSIAAAATVAASGNANILAIILSSLVFGGLHAVTKWYAILATLASLYFGFMFASTGNLAVPIICHALYDVGALLYAHWTVSKMSPQEQQTVADWEG